MQLFHFHSIKYFYLKIFWFITQVVINWRKKFHGHELLICIDNSKLVKNIFFFFENWQMSQIFAIMLAKEYVSPFNVYIFISKPSFNKKKCEENKVLFQAVIFYAAAQFFMNYWITNNILRYCSRKNIFFVILIW